MIILGRYVHSFILRYIDIYFFGYADIFLIWYAEIFIIFKKPMFNRVFFGRYIDSYKIHIISFFGLEFLYHDVAFFLKTLFSHRSLLKMEILHPNNLKKFNKNCFNSTVNLKKTKLFFIFI